VQTEYSCPQGLLKNLDSEVNKILFHRKNIFKAETGTCCKKHNH
jgi:hypothetical protein